MGNGRLLSAQRKDGSLFPAEISLSTLETEDGLITSAAIRDVTERVASQAELRRLNDQLQATNIELRHNADQLAVVNAELTTLDRLKSQFIATVSHELRTPLTSIRGYTELLVDSADSFGPTERRMIGIIDANGQRLLTLIEDLLAFARMEQGHVPLARSAVDVPALIDRCLAVMAPAAGGNNVTLAKHLDASLPTIQVDPAQVERVLLNLLSNAVKFSPGGGTVTVRAGHDGGQATIAVSDSGVGVPADEQHKLFTRFFRSREAERNAIPGTGLGLAICKTVVEAHGGWIAAESAPGVGTTIRFGLPIG
jgi:signal transduction histidine kinase